MKTLSLVGGALLFILVMSGLWFFGKGCNVANHVVDNALINYEEFQEVYNTCVKLNTDLCNMKNTPDDDKMFEQFSKTQRVLAIKTHLNR